MAKVVNLHANRPHVGNLPDYDSTLTRQMRAFVNAKVRDYVSKGGKIRALRLKCGSAVRCDATISKLAYYETARPTHTTVMAVIEALGLMVEYGNMVLAYGKRLEKKSN